MCSNRPRIELLEVQHSAVLFLKINGKSRGTHSSPLKSIYLCQSTWKYFNTTPPREAREKKIGLINYGNKFLNSSFKCYKLSLSVLKLPPNKNIGAFVVIALILSPVPSRWTLLTVQSSLETSCQQWLLSLPPFKLRLLFSSFTLAI